MHYARNRCTATYQYTENEDWTREFVSVTYTGPCVQTGLLYSVKCPIEGIRAYNQGLLIQHAFPTLSADDREFLMSGYSPEGWNQAFPNP